MFRASEPWMPVLPASTTEQLINEFGSDDNLLYVSAIGFVDPRSEAGRWIWPVDRSGNVGTGLDLSERRQETVTVPVWTLLDLLRYPLLTDVTGGFGPEFGVEFGVEFDGDPGEEVGDELDPEELEFDEPVGELSSDGELRLVFERLTFEQTTYGLAADAANELSAVESVGGILWTAAAALAILAALATWIVSGRVLAPVEALTRRVDVLSSTRLQERLPGADRRDEIKNLASTLNKMLDRLEVSDRQRRRFVSDASHELRTPLAVLTNQAEVARSAPQSTSLDALARVVEDETARLASVVEDLLLLARHDELSGSDHSMVQTSDVAFDFDDVVLAEVDRPRRLPVDCSVVSAGRVCGDPVAAARAVGHLLDNASRHAQDLVAVGLRTIGDEVHLTVDDDGTGIPEANRAEVFERFTRLDGSRTRDRGGAGLGLSVVKATFGAMGGTVSVEQSPLGGARFRVVLPAA